MLARRLQIQHDAGPFWTPMLVPALSSKGFQEIDKIVGFMEEIITDQLLISAYDLHHGHMAVPAEFAELTFLDSGGYEASIERDLADLGYGEHVPKRWDKTMLDGVFSSWPKDRPTVVVSYDHPSLRRAVPDQVAVAVELFEGYPGFITEILLKPETRKQKLVQLDSIVEQVRKLGQFDIVGLTEKELGGSIIERMTAIAKLRRAMDAAGVIRPIHVFGSLDPVSSPLYFLAGADIFDGLSWLRLAYMNGLAVYRQNFGALTFGVREHERSVALRSYASNIYYLADLRAQMEKYVLTGDFDQFKDHASFFRDQVTDLEVKLGEEK